MQPGKLWLETQKLWRPRNSYYKVHPHTPEGRGTSHSWTQTLRTNKQHPSTIKQLVALKRKAKATWQKTHAPDDHRIFNNASTKLKTALHKMRNDNFTEYVSTIKSSDHSIWKPLKSRKKPTMPNPPIRANSNPPGPWAESDEEKAELFARHLSEVFTPKKHTYKIGSRNISLDLEKLIQPFNNAIDYQTASIGHWKNKNSAQRYSST